MFHHGNAACCDSAVLSRDLPPHPSSGPEPDQQGARLSLYYLRGESLTRRSEPAPFLYRAIGIHRGFARWHKRGRLEIPVGRPNDRVYIQTSLDSGLMPVRCPRSTLPPGSPKTI